ncbi:hypothetical protein OF001_U70132 [Pseudomonas sp. OF001]|nr:hypothetical protein OF001_U70132 [Pseudomonas sp. OF001]
MPERGLIQPKGFFLFQEHQAHEYAGPVSGHANSYP